MPMLHCGTMVCNGIQASLSGSPPRPPGFWWLPAPLMHPLAQPGGWAKGCVRGGRQPPKPGGSGGREPLRELNPTLFIKACQFPCLTALPVAMLALIAGPLST